MGIGIDTRRAMLPMRVGRRVMRALAVRPTPNRRASERRRALLCALMLALIWPAAMAGPPIPTDGATRVPILVYHTVDDSGNLYSVTPQRLKSQCRWLVAHGYTAITVRQFWRAVRGVASLPSRPVVLTIDDGDVSARRFARILRRYGLVGTYFVNNVSPLSPRQIRALARHGEVQAHTVSHVGLSGLGSVAQIAEISRNTAYLEQITGRSVRFLAWPYGDTSESAIRAAAASGIAAAFALGGVPADLAGAESERYLIPRITIAVGDDLTTFAAKVRGA